MTTFPSGSALGRELQALTETRTLSPEQADQLWRAAEQDRSRAAASSPAQPGGPRTGVLDVLGYIGGALLLGAVVFVAATLWDDLSRGQRIALAVASLVVPLAGGLVLESTRTRRGLGRVLLALASIAAGFCCYTVIEDRDFVLTPGVVVLTAAIGAAVLRSVVFYFPAWVASLFFVAAVVESTVEDDTGGSALVYATAGGFGLVGLLLLLSGLRLGRPVAWTLAGLSGWLAAMVLVTDEHSILAVVLATIVAAALFVGVVRQQRYGYAVVGCLLVLSIWPWALYQILDSAFGVAVGLVAAGCVLIAAAVVLARLRRRPAAPARV